MRCVMTIILCGRKQNQKAPRHVYERGKAVNLKLEVYAAVLPYTFYFMTR